MSKQSKKLSPRQYIKAISEVAKLSFRTAPGAVSMKLMGAIITAVLPIIVTYFAALTTTALVEAYAGNPDAGRQAIVYVLIAAGLGLFSTVWQSVDQYVQQMMRYRVEAKVGDAMYVRFLSLEFWQYDDKDTADLYDRAQRFSQFYAYVFDRLAGVLSQLITLVVALVALVLVLPWIALVVIIAVIPGIYIQFKLSRAQVAHWNKNVDVRRTKSYIEWNLLQPKSIAELRLYGVVRHLLDLRQKLRDKDEKERLVQERSYIGKRLLGDALETGAEVTALVWIVQQIIVHAQPVGQFIYVQQIVSRALGGANGFVSQLSTIDEDLANLFDYQQFMDMPVQKKSELALASAPKEISIKDMSFHYPVNDKRVLKHITMNITRGQHIAIVGENGAGKSTLIKLITGLYMPTSGHIFLDGKDLREYAPETWHQYLSVLQQDFVHYSFTSVKDNIYFGDVSKVMKPALLREATKKAEADSFIDKLPQKMETYPSNWMEDSKGNKGMDLSGGQWQRLALARNFYRDAPIIILDEPTSAIDALAEARIFNRLFAKSNAKTVITISHRLTTVEKADVIYVLKDGEIVQRGNHADLAGQQSGEYVRMFAAQLKQPMPKS